MNAASPAPRPSVALWAAAGLVVPADVDRRLRAGGAALEIGCGGGVGCLALAETYPAARILGHDRDPRSIARAAALAEAAGLSARVRFCRHQLRTVAARRFRPGGRCKGSPIAPTRSPS